MIINPDFIIEKERHHRQGWVYLYENPHTGLFYTLWKSDGRKWHAQTINDSGLKDINDAEDVYFGTITGDHDDQLVFKKTKQVRDAQKNRLYHWENSVITRHPLADIVMGKSEIIDMVEQVCEDLKMKPFQVEFTNRGITSYFISERNAVRIHRGGRNRLFLLHEISHGFIHNVLESPYKRKFQDHGKEFTGTAMALYENYIGVDRMKMITTANQHKVKYNMYEIGDLVGFSQKIQT